MYVLYFEKSFSGIVINTGFSPVTETRGIYATLTLLQCLLGNVVHIIRTVNESGLLTP